MNITPKLLVFAYPQEAEPFQKFYNTTFLFHLKHIQYYYSEQNNTYIIVCESGSINTSVALSVFFERFASLKNNILCFNVGIAGSYTLPLFEIFLASKVTNYHHLKSFSPDIFIKTNYAPLMSIEFPANAKIMKSYPEYMFDMEAWAFVSTLKFFVKNHQIHCIKFISDNNGQIDDIFQLLENYQNQTNKIIGLINQISSEYEKYQHTSSSSKTEFIQQIITNLPLTQSQQVQLSKALQYAMQHHLNEQQIQNIIQQYNFNSTKHKREKNQIFKNLLNHLYNV
ncbi:MAG: hypothetical protein OHK0036_12640 [Bacteroidia bacterium]